MADDLVAKMQVQTPNEDLWLDYAPQKWYPPALGVCSLSFLLDNKVTFRSVTTCPSEAIRLVAKPEESRKVPPATSAEQMMALAGKRGIRF